MLSEAIFSYAENLSIGQSDYSLMKEDRAGSDEDIHDLMENFCSKVELSDLEQSICEQAIINRFSRCVDLPHTLQNAQVVEMAPEGWAWIPVEETENYRLGMLVVYSQQPIPLHDHPRGSGISMLLKGSANVQRYHVTKHDGSFTHLKVLQNEILNQGSFTFYGTEVGNVHGIESLSERCVFLVITTVAYRWENRSFYFKIKDNQGSDSILAHRIKIKKS